MKNFLFSLIFYFSFTLFCFSQNNTVIEERDGALVLPQVEAEFPGGRIALTNYLQKNLNYPKEADSLRISGKVYVYFEIDTLGDIHKVSIKRGVHPLLDNEALRVISKMPRWKPAFFNGNAVNSKYILPVNFYLSNE